jgi:hypothetical protein
VATNTDAYGIVASVATSVGTIIQPGVAAVQGTISASASADRTAGASVASPVSAFTDADPSVKRAGQSTTDRDGYARVSISATVLPAADKFSMGEASAASQSDSSATAVWVQGGAATVVCRMVIEATGANDGAFAMSTAYVTANASAVMRGEAVCSPFFDIVPFGSAQQPASAELVDVVAIVSADSRLALIAAVDGVILSAVDADARLALRAEVDAVAESVATAFATGIRPSGAQAVIAVGMGADATRICNGEVSAVVAAVVKPMAITNPTVPAPFERTLRVPAEDRVMRVPYENRSMKVT